MSHSDAVFLVILVSLADSTGEDRANATDDEFRHQREVRQGPACHLHPCGQGGRHSEYHLLVVVCATPVYVRKKYEDMLLLT